VKIIKYYCDHCKKEKFSNELTDCNFSIPQFPFLNDRFDIQLCKDCLSEMGLKVPEQFADDKEVQTQAEKFFNTLVNEVAKRLAEASND
jgi:hypothetical protein